MKKTIFFRTMLLAVIVVASNVGVNAQYSGTGTFNKITSIAELTDGYYVIVNKTDEFAMSNSHTGVYLEKTDITPAGGVLTNPAVSIVWEIKAHADGGYTIFNETTSKFVSCDGSGNNVQVVDAVTSENERWNISYESNLFVFKNIANPSRMLQYYSAHTRFACYTSIQHQLLLYKLSGAAPDPVPSPTANEPTNKTTTGFTAGWSEVAEATGYKLDVYTKTETPAADLFISEYVEGSSYNKAIEIYNGTGTDVDLSNYSIKKQRDGAGEYGDELTLSGTLSNNSVFVIAYVAGSNSASPEILAVTNLQSNSNAINYNGNDAVALFKNGIQIDEVGVFGQVDYWGQDLTLVRKADINSPKFPYDVSDWTVYEKDNIADLGSHTMNNTSSTSVPGYPITTTETSYVVSGLSNTETYYYAVAALKNADESPFSNEIGPISLLPTGLQTAKLNAKPG